MTAMQRDEIGSRIKQKVERKKQQIEKK